MVQIYSMPWERLPDKVMSTQLLAIRQRPYDGSTTVDILCPVWFLLVNEGKCMHEINEPAKIGARSFVVLDGFFDNALVWLENVSLPNRLFSCMHFMISYPLPAFTLNDWTPH